MSRMLNNLDIPVGGTKHDISEKMNFKTDF